MPVASASRPTINRPVLGEIKSHINISTINNDKGNQLIFPVKLHKPIIKVIDGLGSIAARSNKEVNVVSTNEINTFATQDDDNHEPATKRSNCVPNMTRDKIANKDTSNNSDDRRASLVSPTYSEENFDSGNDDDDDDIAALEEEASKEGMLSGYVNNSASKTTSETIDAARAVANGHKFSTPYLEKMTRIVIRPQEGESIEEALKAMKSVCLTAMADSGKNWKSIVEDEDKYNLLSSNDDIFRDRIVEKALYVVGVLDVVSDTFNQNLPPTVIKSCELGRSKVLEWLGTKASDLKIPASRTVYAWFRDFCHKRNFSHPQRAIHIKMQVLDNLDRFFTAYPVQKQIFKAHVQSVLKQQCRAANSTSGDVLSRDGTVDGNAFDFFSYFVSTILRPLSTTNNPLGTKRGTDVRDSDGIVTATKVIPKSQEGTAMYDYLVENVTWQHLLHWMNKNWDTARCIVF